MNRYQSAEYERCRNNGCCQNNCDGQNDRQNNGCSRNDCGCYAESQYDSCAEAAVAGNNGCGWVSTASNGNGCGCAAARVADLPSNACICAVIAKINELLGVLRDTGVIGECD